jgi:hypothetical protein
VAINVENNATSVQGDNDQPQRLNITSANNFPSEVHRSRGI